MKKPGFLITIDRDLDDVQDARRCSQSKECRAPTLMRLNAAYAFAFAAGLLGFLYSDFFFKPND